MTLRHKGWGGGPSSVGLWKAEARLRSVVISSTFEDVQGLS